MMGKLHTLRRAIERDPESWVVRGNFNKRVYRVKGASRYVGNRKWIGCALTDSYSAFVEHVLNDLGYNLEGGRQCR